MNARQKEILKLIAQAKEISVALLAETLGISQVTLRKDLDALAQDGYVKRHHGTVSVASEDDVASRLLIGFEEKMQIATRAAALVSDGDTIMIESGSTCALLAKVVAQSKCKVTIVTNSLFISDFIRDYNTIKVVVLGGDFQPEARVMVGPITALCAKQFFVSAMFCGVDGMVEDYGFTVNDHLRAATVRDMAATAQNVYILTESKKFSMRGAAAQLPFESVRGIVTDACIPQEIKTLLEEKGLQVITDKE
jgi:DeoR/GlpR family transcriptional regulator of sugar metabolism